MLWPLILLPTMEYYTYNSCLASVLTCEWVNNGCFGVRRTYPAARMLSRQHCWRGLNDWSLPSYTSGPILVATRLVPDYESLRDQVANPARARHEEDQGYPSHLEPSRMIANTANECRKFRKVSARNISFQVFVSWIALSLARLRRPSSQQPIIRCQCCEAWRVVDLEPWWLRW